MKLLFPFILFFSTQSFADSPNSQFEKLIFDLYQKYYSDPISPTEWKDYIKNVKEEKYVVKSGDTLWALSKIFFADPLFWSKIWALNSDLTNPHVISVGKELRFIQGTENEPPTLVVTSENNEIQAATKPLPINDSESGKEVEVGAKEESKAKASIVQIPESQTTTSPLLRVIPSSFKESNDAAFFKQEEFKADLRPNTVDTTEMEILSFPSDSRLNDEGEVIGVLGIEGGIAIREQELLIRLPKETSLGAIVYAVTRVSDLSSSRFDGYTFNYSAKLKVLEFTPEGDVRVKVEQSYWPVKAGDKVITTPPAVVKINPNAPIQSGDWKVFAGAESKERKQFSFNEMVYLDAGSEQGISHGSLVEVFQKIDMPGEGVIYSSNPKAILQIVNVLPNISAGIVLRNNMPVIKGDKAGRTVKE